MIRRIAAVACLIAAFSNNTFAQFHKPKPNQVRLNWEMTTSMIEGKRVRLALPNGSMVEGKVLSARGDSLTVDVRKSLEKRKQPKGPVTIPRSGLHAMQIQKVTVRGRVGGSILGGLFGLAIGTGAAINASEYGSGGADNAIPIGLVVGGIGGYFAGHVADHQHWLLITIVP